MWTKIYYGDDDDTVSSRQGVDGTRKPGLNFSVMILSSTEIVLCASPSVKACIFDILTCFILGARGLIGVQMRS
jgi:hypothetical protein